MHLCLYMHACFFLDILQNELQNITTFPYTFNNGGDDVATPQNSPEQHKHQAPRKSRGWAGMLIGFAICIGGLVLAFPNITNNPPLFDLGAVLTVAGAMVTMFSAIRRDRRRRNRPRPNGNGA